MKYVKKVLLALVVLFAAFYIVTRPEDAADSVRWVFRGVQGAFDAIVRFFTSLVG